jgi:hypothetical protein
LRLAAVVFAAALLAVPGPESAPEEGIRRALRAGTGVVVLPAGDIEISSELSIGPSAHDLEIRGASSGTTLRAASHFHGRAIFVCESASHVRLAGFTINGNRAQLEQRSGLPASNQPFAQFTRGNGILAIHAAGLAVSDVRFVNVPGFAILASASRDVAIDRVTIADSGSRSDKGRNNTTGGILLEEGTEHFRVTRCEIRNVRGNGVWTHSLYTSPRNNDGRIENNQFERIGRDAIQAGHATRIQVENNTGRLIGFPENIVDVEGFGTPVALDTAGNTDHSAYVGNRFEEVNGQCIDLDGFHDGEVRGNACINRQSAGHYPNGHYGIVVGNNNPDMRSEGIVLVDNEIDGAIYGGIFLIGTHNRVLRNHLRRLNLARCEGSGAKPACNYALDQPDLLRSGIYLGTGGPRPAPARGNVIEDNEVSGFGISKHCIAAAPGVSLAANSVARNTCKNDPAR